MVNRARDGEDENGSPEIAGFFSTAILARRKFVAKKVTKGLLGMNIDGKRAQFNFDDNMRPFPRIIVSVDVYADESGTHDPAGKRPGAEVAAICGYAGWKNKLRTFSRQWKDHLKLNGVSLIASADLARHYDATVRSAIGFGKRHRVQRGSQRDGSIQLSMAL